MSSATLPLPGSVVPITPKPYSIDANGREVEFSVESGVVISVDKRSHTRIHGQFNNGNGYVSSSTSYWTEFSLACTDGIERPHYFNDQKMPLRYGQRVSLLYAKYRGENWAWILNHDTRKWHCAWSVSHFMSSIGLVQRITWSFIFYLMVTIVIGLIMFPPPNAYKSLIGSPLLMLSGGLVVLKAIQWWRARRLWKNYIQPEFEQFSDELLNSTEQIPWPRMR